MGSATIHDLHFDDPFLFEKRGGVPYGLLFVLGQEGVGVRVALETILNRPSANCHVPLPNCMLAAFPNAQKGNQLTANV